MNEGDAITFNLNQGINPAITIWQPDKVALCSDLHFGHNKEFIYKKRGFNSIEEHDEFIVNDLWAEDNGITDILCLGDMGWNVSNNVYWKHLKQINSKTIWLVPGNHDKPGNTFEDINVVPNMTMCKFNLSKSAQSICFSPGMILSHMPLLTHDFTKHINLCGHCHGALGGICLNRCCIELSVDNCLDYTNHKHCYITFKDIQRLIETRFK